jgi:hypothetical protein
MQVFIDSLSSPLSYTVEGLGNDNGGNVVFDAAPDDGASITLQRVLPIRQTQDYTPGTLFPAASHEATLDRLVMMLQQTNQDLIDVYNYLGIGTETGGVIFPVTAGDLPDGAIVMWAGAPADIPNNFFLCDGTNGTPDFSGRFIVSYDEGGSQFATVGETGGSFTTQDSGAVSGSTNGHALTLNEMPNHKHDASPDPATVLGPGSGSTNTGGGQQQEILTVEGVTGHGLGQGVAQAHSHGIDLPVHNHDYVPLYYTLAFLQYQASSEAPEFTGAFPNQTYTDSEVITPIDMSGQFDVGDGVTVNFELFGAPAGITIDSSTGIISGTIDAAASTDSPYEVIVTLTTDILPPATTYPTAIWTVNP